MFLACVLFWKCYLYLSVSRRGILESEEAVIRHTVCGASDDSQESLSGGYVLDSSYALPSQMLRIPGCNEHQAEISREIKRGRKCDRERQRDHIHALDLSLCFFLDSSISYSLRDLSLLFIFSGLDETKRMLLFWILTFLSRDHILDFVERLAVSKSFEIRYLSLSEARIFCLGDSKNRLDREKGITLISMGIASLCIAVIPTDLRKPLRRLIVMSERSRLNLIELLEGCLCVCASGLASVTQFHRPDHWCYSRLDLVSHVHSTGPWKVTEMGSQINSERQGFC